MASPNQRTGIAYVYIDGDIYESMNDAVLTNFSGMKRTAVEGATVAGFTQSIAAPTLTASFVHGGNLSLEQLWAVDNSTVTLQCDSGINYILRNAWVSEIGNFDTSKGTVQITFQAKSCEEQAS